MSWPRFDRVRRWLLPAACLAAPKCALCLLGYAGLGAALGLGSPELCGAPEAPGISPVLLGAAGAGVVLLYRLANRSRARVTLAVSSR